MKAYEKEGRDIFISPELRPHSRAKKLLLKIEMKKLKLKILAQILIKGPPILLLTKTEISTKRKIDKAASNIKVVI